MISEKDLPDNSSISDTDNIEVEKIILFRDGQSFNDVEEDSYYA